MAPQRTFRRCPPTVSYGGGQAGLGCEHVRLRPAVTLLEGIRNARGSLELMMTVLARPLFAFDNSYVRELEGMYVPWHAVAAGQQGLGEPRQVPLRNGRLVAVGVAAGVIDRAEHRRGS